MSRDKSVVITIDFTITHSKAIAMFGFKIHSIQVLVGYPFPLNEYSSMKCKRKGWVSVILFCLDTIHVIL